MSPGHGHKMQYNDSFILLSSTSRCGALGQYRKHAQIPRLCHQAKTDARENTIAHTKMSNRYPPPPIYRALFSSKSTVLSHSETHRQR